jgi:hypothetical protein
MSNLSVKNKKTPSFRYVCWISSANLHINKYTVLSFFDKEAYFFYIHYIGLKGFASELPIFHELGCKILNMGDIRVLCKHTTDISKD